jgi:lysophospholipase L1-like esterase
MKALQALMITNFDNAAFLPNVYLANAGQCIDRVNGYPYKLETISARVTEQQLQHWDSVHPNEAGYNQMADVYYARVKAII